MRQPDRTPLLAEEVQVIGHTDDADTPDWLDQAQALALLEKAHPDTNIGDEERHELVSTALAGWSGFEATINQHLESRAEALTDANRRIRQAVSMKVLGLTVKPQLPPDLLSLLVLQPLVQK